MKKLLILFIGLLISCSIFADNDPNSRDKLDNRMDGHSNGDVRRSNGDDSSKNDPDGKAANARDGISKAGFTLCAGEFALCASSTCTPTGKTITVKEDGGKTTKQYPEAVCKCPVVTPNIAEQNGSPLAGIAGLNEGNMNGSCRSPGSGKIWSFFSTTIHTYPQEQPDHSFMQPTTATNQNCSAKGPSQGSNCWSYICTVDPKETNGVKTATCKCPYGEGVFGQSAKSNRGYVTFAGGTWSDPPSACKKLPVGFPDQLLQ